MCLNTYTHFSYFIFLWQIRYVKHYGPISINTLENNNRDLYLLFKKKVFWYWSTNGEGPLDFSGVRIGLFGVRSLDLPNITVQGNPSTLPSLSSSLSFPQISSSRNSGFVWMYIKWFQTGAERRNTIFFWLIFVRIWWVLV